MLNRRPTKSDEPAVTAVELIAAIARKADALRQRDRDLVNEQIILEQAKIAPAAPSATADPRDLAREMLNGFAPPEPAGKPEQRLFAILHERAGIAIALDLLQQQDLQSRVLAVGQVTQARGEDWRALVRERALALIALRRANKACSDFRKSVTEVAGMAPGLICDRSGGLLFGPPVVGDQAYVFLTDCMRAGFIGREDLDA
jgi:hypothetical protein